MNEVVSNVLLQAALDVAVERETQIETLEKQIRTLKSQLDQRYGWYKKAMNRAQSAERALGCLKIELRQTKEAFERYRNEGHSPRVVQSLQRQLMDSESDRRTAERRVAALENTRDSLEKDYQECQMQCATLKAQAADHERQMRCMRGCAANLRDKEEIERLKSGQRCLREDFRKMLEQRNDALDRVRILSRQLDSATKRNEALKAQEGINRSRAYDHHMDLARRMDVLRMMTNNQQPQIEWTVGPNGKRVVKVQFE